MNAGFGLGLLVGLGLGIGALIWYMGPSRAWATRAAGYDVYARPDDLMEQARILASMPGRSLELRRLSQVPSSDPDTEKLRVLTNHRGRILYSMVPIFAGVTLGGALLGALTERAWSAGAGATGVEFAGLLVLGWWGVRLARALFRYGHGATISRWEVAAPTLGIGAMSLVMLIQLAILAGRLPML